MHPTFKFEFEEKGAIWPGAKCCTQADWCIKKFPFVLNDHKHPSDVSGCCSAISWQVCIDSQTVTLHSCFFLFVCLGFFFVCVCEGFFFLLFLKNIQTKIKQLVMLQIWCTVFRLEYCRLQMHLERAVWVSVKNDFLCVQVGGPWGGIILKLCVSIKFFFVFVFLRFSLATLFMAYHSFTPSPLNQLSSDSPLSYQRLFSCRNPVG